MRALTFLILFLITTSSLTAQKLSIRDLHKIYACRVLSIADTFLENRGYNFAVSMDSAVMYKYSKAYYVLVKFSSKDFKIKDVVFNSKKPQFEWDFESYYQDALDFGYKLIAAVPEDDLMKYYYIHDWEKALDLVIIKRTESLGQASFIMVNLYEKMEE